MPFEVTSYHELLTLQKVFFEAKFAEIPEVDELLGSPLVSDMWTRVIRELQQVQPKHGLSGAQEGWEQWLREKIKVNGREWKIVLNRSKKYFGDKSKSVSEKLEYAKELFRPFILNEDAMQEFVRQAVVD